jgi:Arm DNA-binding domain
MTSKSIAAVLALKISDNTKLKLIGVLVNDDLALKKRHGRPLNRLTALRVHRLAKPGRYGDGGGLYLEISNGGGKSWVFMWKRQGKRTAMGLGSTQTVSLADARRAADECRRNLYEGRNPMLARRAKLQATEERFAQPAPVKQRREYAKEY